MRQRSFGTVCSFLLSGTMALAMFPYSGNLVYAQEEENEMTQPAATEEMKEPTIEDTEIPTENSESSVLDGSASEVEQQEIENGSSQNSLDQPQEVPNTILNTDGVIEVPAEGMVIVNGVYYGVSKKWYTENNPDQKVLSLSLKIPNDVTTIGDDGFKDSWSNNKQKHECITNYDGGGKYTTKYTVVNIDFSNATSLTTINNQAAMGCSSLTGVLDLSSTKLVTLRKSAFNGCTGLSGVILPETLKNIGNEDSGSTFKDCTSLQFVRTTSSDPNTVFELPKNLEVIGGQSFNGCTGFPANTTVSIPASVTFVGNEAFHNSPNITTILVQAENASNYHAKAFKGNDYGLGKRLTVFKNSSAKESFNPSANNAYSNSLTYEFTLHYAEKSEQKLWGQPVNVCKSQDGSWFVDENYVIPKTDVSVPVGYVGGWTYENDVLTKDTILKPQGNELTLTASCVLQEPTVQFIVDGKVIETENTHPELNLSNNKEHTIGVEVSHPIETVEDADVNVKFEYEWTDVWNGGHQGPRMSEDGFGRYNLWDKPKVKNTIIINGAQHERTDAGNYSGEDYGDGYYLLEIYGYSCPKTGGEWKKFYKSAHTKIEIPDPERTTDTAYLFKVVTSEPAQKPEVTFTGNVVEYGYEQAKLIASVSEIAGQTNTYQWYKASKENPSSNGEKIEGATSTSLPIEKGIDVGEYYYYLEVTSTKTLNGDAIQTDFPVTFMVKDKGGKPTDPDKPVNPDKPTNPNKPVDPDKPANSNKPTAPNKPGNSNKPSNSNKPGNSNSSKPAQQNTNKPNKSESVHTGRKTNLFISSLLLLVSGVCVLVVSLRLHKLNEEIQ